MTEIVTDLEAPVIVETNIYGEDSTERRRKEPLDSPHEGLIRVAAEALVAISSSQAPDMQEKATCRNLEASENDSLLWFAELISSHDGNLDNGNAKEVKQTSCDEEALPVDMDFFEHLTLNLVETKEEHLQIQAAPQKKRHCQNGHEEANRGGGGNGRISGVMYFPVLLLCQKMR
ncbi:hypothetical protein D8674_018336 [Pyrus ussuriensis x Pyrus communis]|uniref:Uncharacterized protein n=1 Tax=Pyrus ussuriensis x Pyrus communis TaxID=2448454 RepID=A0A5N5GHS5_9ROSA|nr:hypothetical protein D8674_018336 [Pyrus ussuriensis x Pyrus communis]